MPVFGKRETFCIEYVFEPDPDYGAASLIEESWSWGKFALWVRGRNLCRSICQTETSDWVHWYLLPLFQWFIDNWYAIVSEERFPVACKNNVAQAVFENQSLFPYNLDDAQSAANSELWYDWWMRHALRAGREGGLFPNVFFRRVGCELEISWKESPLAGMLENFSFIEGDGAALFDLQMAAEVLLPFLNDAIGELLLRHPETAVYCELKDSLQAIGMEQKKGFEYEYIFGGMTADVVEKISSLIEKFDSASSTVRTVPQFGAVSMMFGAVSPCITEEDVLTIGANLKLKSESERNRPLIDQFIKVQNKNLLEKPAYIGYELAEEFCESASFSAGVDVESWLEARGVLIRRCRLTDSTIRAIAAAGEKITPTIIVNEDSSYNNNPEGQRFTLAHELCHLLYDRSLGKELGIMSGPWAPQWVEKRANAFAAMLLMPPDALKSARENNVSWNKEHIQSAARKLKVGAVALTRHLCNIGELCEIDSERILSELEGFRSDDAI